MKVMFALGLEIEMNGEEWPKATQIRRALQEKLDKLGDVELEEAVWEVEE